MDNKEMKAPKESEKFQKKTSSIILTVLIGLIVVSFMFSGYESMYGRTSSDTVAKVGDYSVKSREFSQEYQRQVQFFTQFMNGGNSLTESQIEQFRIQESAMRNLVNKKIALILGDRLGAQAGSNETREAIRDLPYFKTNNQFDVEKYKLLLRHNSLTPSEFEDEIQADLKLKKVQALLETTPVSKTYEKEIAEIKKEKVLASFVKIDRKVVTKKFPISDAEIKAYLQTPEGAKRVEGLFADKKASLNQPLQVKARHILMIADESNDAKVKERIEDLSQKVNAKNFAELAKKNSEDPQSKVKGGDLGWFEKGRMVPEFDEAVFSMKVGTISKPIKTTYGYHIIMLEDKKEPKEARLEDYKNDIAKETLQLNKAPEVTKLIQTLKDDIFKALEKGDTAKAEKLAESYGLNFKKNVTLNRLDGSMDLPLRIDQLNNIFAQKLTAPRAIEFEDAENPVVAYISPYVQKEGEKKDESGDSQKKAEKMATSRALQQDIIKALENSVRVKIFLKGKAE